MIRRESSRRIPLFATSSLAAVGLMLSVGAVGLFSFGPEAVGAEECGVQAPGANSFNCPPGTYPTGIVYPATPGDLTLTLQDTPGGSVVTTTGGIQIIGSPGDNLTVNRSASATGSADPSITNLSGPGVGVTSPDSNIALDFTDPDPSTNGIAIIGSTTGVSALTGGAGNVTFTLTNGSVIGQAYDGVDLIAIDGNATANLAGNITGAQSGVMALTTGGGDATVNLGAGNTTFNVLAGTGSGVVGDAAGNGNATVNVLSPGNVKVTNGATGAVGIEALTNSVATGSRASASMTGSSGGTVSVEGGGFNAGFGALAQLGGSAAVVSNAGRTVTIGLSGGDNDTGVAAITDDLSGTQSASVALGADNTIRVGNATSFGGVGRIRTASGWRRSRAWD